MSRISEEDIVACLKNFNINVSLQELGKPTKELVIRVYTSFINSIEDGNALAQPDLAASHGIKNVESMDQAIFASNLSHALCYYLPDLHEKLGINITDILEPTRVRNNQIIAQLIKLFIRVSQYTDAEQAIRDKYASIVQRKMQAMNRVKESKSELDEKSILLSTLKDRSAEQNLHNQIVELDNARKNKEAAIEEPMKKTEAIKDEIEAARSKLIDLDLNFAKVKEDIAQYKSQIIDSPGELISQCNNMENEIEKLKEDEKDLKEEFEKATEEKNLQRKGFNEKHGKFKELLTLVEDFEEIILNGKKLEDYKEQLVETDQENHRVEVEMKSTEASLHDKRQMISKDNKAQARERDTLESLIKGMKARCIEQENKLKIYTEETASLRRKIEEEIKRSDKIDQDKVQLQHKHEKAIEEILALRMKSLDRALASVNSSTQPVLSERNPNVD